MKPLFRLPVSAAALAALCFVGQGAVRAEDPEPSRLAAADALLTSMHTDKLAEGNTARLLGQVDRLDQAVAQQGATLSDEQQGTLKKAEDEARETIKKELGYGALKEGFVKIYAENFTEAELKELTTFYNTPIGQKFLDKQQLISGQIGQSATQKMKAVLPGVMQRLNETAQKVLPPPPTPATVVPPPGGMVPPPPAAPLPSGGVTTPVPPTTPMPPTAPVPPTAVTPPVTTAPVSAIPTPLPTVSGASTPSAQ